MIEHSIGDSLPVDILTFTANECAVSATKLGFEAVCVLDAGHTGRHIAVDADMVIRAAWD
jgi:hypothetical protein